MRILIATPLYPPEAGGPATYIRELSERLSGKRHLTIAALTLPGAPHIGQSTLIPIPKSRSRFLRFINFFWILFYAARQHDVIYAQNAVAAGFPSVLAGILRRKPVVIKFVGDESWERAMASGRTKKSFEEFLFSPNGGVQSRLIRMVQKFTLRRAAYVITPSAYLADLLLRAYKLTPRKVVVNFNAFELKDVSQKERNPHQIAVVARLVPWKGVDGIIRAVAAVRKQFPDVRLAIAGDGPEREHLESLTRELSVREHVAFLGTIPKEEVIKLYAESGLFVLNSTYEGLPHSVLESFGAKTPVVASDINGTREVVFHEKTGLLVDSGNDQALEEAIVRMFTDDVLRSSLVLGATGLLEEKFSWAMHLARLEEILKSASADAKRRA